MKATQFTPTHSASTSGQAMAGAHVVQPAGSDLPEVAPVTIPVDPSTVFLTIDDVERETTYKRSTIYQMVKDGSFVAPVKLGKRATRWVLADVLAWKEKVIAESRGEAK